MASHIATEEWQSFELRMRRRRAERMFVRAEAALDSQCFEEAREALDEARRLCPSLPSLHDLEARMTRAAERAEARPVGARARRALAAAAGLVLVASAGVFGWRAARNPSPLLDAHGASPPATAQAAPALIAPASAASPAAPSVSPSIKVETEQVPPVIVSGASGEVEPSSTPAETGASVAPAAAAPTRPVVSAQATDDLRTVGTTGPPTQPEPAPADVGAIAALGKETPMPAPEPALDRIARVRNPPTDVSPLPAEPIVRRAEMGAAPAPSVPKRPDDAALVRNTLNRYAEAYTHLDADAAKAVWPTVNRAALSKAFSGLTEQRIAFADCAVDVRSTEARATCSGSTTWEPKIGGGLRTDVRKWAFDLEKSGDGWIIRDARVQNR